MDGFWLGLVMGITIAAPIRISFGQFVIWTPVRGWVLRWERFDDRDTAQQAKDDPHG